MSVILDQAGVLPEAQYVSVQAGAFKVTLTVAEARDPNVMLALTLNDQTLPLEHGGPCRLVAPTKACYFSVKWVDRIEVTAERPEETGQQIAQARNRQRSGS